MGLRERCGGGVGVSGQPVRVACRSVGDALEELQDRIGLALRQLLDARVDFGYERGAGLRGPRLEIGLQAHDRATPIVRVSITRRVAGTLQTVNQRRRPSGRQLQ